MASSANAAAPTRVRVRRNPRWLAFGILLVAVGGLASAFLFMSIADSRPAIKVNRTVYRGEQLKASDLSVIDVGRHTDLDIVPGDDLNSLVDETAVTDLAQGSLLVRGTVGRTDLMPGLSRVGLKLPPGRMPMIGMPPGTQILVVAVADKASGPKQGMPPSVPATLTNAPTVQADGSYVVDINLPADQAEEVARLAAADRVVVVRRGQEG